jgi:hypothetical protein
VRIVRPDGTSVQMEDRFPNKEILPDYRLAPAA